MATDTNNKYKNILLNGNGQSTVEESNYSMVERLLENEKQHNKTESWNKLDKTVKTQKLHQFAEKYGKETGLPIKEIKGLKAYFIECLDKNKLQKTKDIHYDKEKHEIVSIPALHFNQQTRSFTLRIMDTKRVSTLKSLTPKRISAKNTVDIINDVKVDLDVDVDEGIKE